MRQGRPAARLGSLTTLKPTRFVIIGGGPGGNTAASYAARHGAEVVLIEKDIFGGAAHLWDCIPSKAMIATGGAMSFLARAQGMGLGDVSPRIDVDNLSARLASIEDRIHRSTRSLLENQNVRLIDGTGSLKGPHQVVAETADGLADWLARHPSLGGSPAGGEAIDFLAGPPLSTPVKVAYRIIHDAAVATVPMPILAAIGLRPRRGAIARGRLLIRGLRATLGASPAWAAALERCGEDRPDGVRFRSRPGTTR